MTDSLAAMLGYSERTKDRFLLRLERLAGRPIADFDLLRMGGGAPATLVVHDREDKEVPYADGVRLAQAWDSAELLSTTGLGHQRIAAVGG